MSFFKEIGYFNTEEPARDTCEPWVRRAELAGRLATMLRGHGVQAAEHGDTVALVSPVRYREGDSLDKFMVSPNPGDDTWIYLGTDIITLHWERFRARAARFGWELPSLEKEGM